MRGATGWLAATLMLAAPSNLWAQDADADSDVFERGCGDDRGVDRCDDAIQARMHALYEIDAPEAVLARDITMRRAMVVDGYGGDVVALTLFREPGDGPRIEVRAPGGDHPPLEAALSLEQWRRAGEAMELFDRKLEPEVEADGRPAPPPICLHSWVAVLEAVDAPRVHPNVVLGTGSADRERDPRAPVDPHLTKAQIRRATQNACGPSLAWPAAYALAEIATEALDACGTLDPDHHRGAFGLLAFCARMRGDRLAAGQADGMGRSLDTALRSEDAMALRRLFVGVGARRSDAFRAAIGDADRIALEPPEGIDADHVRLKGRILFYSDDREEEADVRLDLIRSMGDFVIDTFEVGERRALSGGE